MLHSVEGSGYCHHMTGRPGTNVVPNSFWGTPVQEGEREQIPCPERAAEEGKVNQQAGVRMHALLQQERFGLI